MTNMVEEVVEQAFFKWKKEEVGYLKTYYEPSALENAAATWKKKSVSIVSPKSGRVLKQNKDAEKIPEKTEQNGKVIKDNGFFSRIFDDFKKAKVSDYTYQKPKVREHSSYKPFWATKTVVTKTEKIEDKIGKSSCTVQKNAVTNKKIIFVKEAVGSPKVTLTAKPRSCTPKKVLSTVDYHKEYRLKMPPNYSGSQMRMPTGEQLFWVCFYYFT